MAIINSYPLVVPKLTDLILGTSAGSNGRNKTASFTVGAMQSLMAGVTSVTSGNVNTIVIGGTTQQPTVGTVTATITLASNSLATGAQIATYVATNHPGTVSGTGTFNTLSKWSANGIDIEDSAILDNAAGETITITSRQVWPATTDSKDLGGTDNRWKNIWASQTLYAENIVLGSFATPPTAVNTYISLQGSTGTAGQVLTSGGNGLSATWTDNVSGTGTINTVPIFTSARAIGDSLISQASNGIIIDGVGTDGKLTLNCSAGTHGVTLQSPPHASSATYTLILPTTSGVAGQVLSSGGGSPSQLVWSTQAASGVQSVVTGNTDTITVGGTASDPTIAANTAAVTAASPNLATGAQIQTAINAALVGTLEFKGGFNAGTGAIDGGGNLTNATSVAVSVGDFYVVTTAGSFYGSVQLEIGDQVIAQTAAAAGASTIANWIEVEGNVVVATDSVQGVANFPTAGGLTVATGAVSMPDTGVTAGTYTNTNLTVDAKGRITTAASGSAGGYVGWNLTGDSGTNASVVNNSNVTITGGAGITTTASTFNLDIAAAGFAGVAIAGNAGYVPDSTAATAGTFLQADGTWAAAGGLPTITVNTGSQAGTQTVYPLSVTPSSVNYVNVFINGVYQAKSSYSVSGTNLTFAAAPPNNSVIEFVTTT